MSEGAVARCAAGAMVEFDLCDDAAPWPGAKLGCDWLIDGASDDFGAKAGSAEHNISPFAERLAAAMLNVAMQLIV